MARAYYSLVASLPRLVHFDRAERLPITRPRLDERLSTLDAAHGRALGIAESLILWHQQPLGRTDRDVATLYRAGLAEIADPELADFVRFRMDQRTMIAGLRKRLLGGPAPAPGEPWGIEPRASWVRRHWDAPDFDLTSRYRWVGDAARLLETRDALGLERLLMQVVWDRLGRVAEARPFGFEQVFAFVFRWDIVRRWLSYQPDAAAVRFGSLVTEALGEHQRKLV